MANMEGTRTPVFVIGLRPEEDDGEDDDVDRADPGDPRAWIAGLRVNLVF